MARLWQQPLRLHLYSRIRSCTTTCTGESGEAARGSISAFEDSGDTVTEPSGERFPKRRKCVLLLSYNGKGFFGMQRNPGVPTVEEELVGALVKAEAVPQSMEDDLSKFQFQRCSRTDKGVSAARQVVSLKMVPDADIVERINGYLPPQIRVMAMKRVTKSFHSKWQCSARTYEYLLPTYAFAPADHTSLKYRIDDSTVERLDQLLGQYVGTHRFHNFTSGKRMTEPSARRHILSFHCGDRFLINARCEHCAEERGIEFMTIAVKGQSFMVHQIRKMIGLAIAIVRGFTGDDSIATAYQSEGVDIPRAPSIGLLLENVHYDGYNRRYGGDGTHQPLLWTDNEEEVLAFKRDHIHQDIISTEVKDMWMTQWLAVLPRHYTQSQLRMQQHQKATAYEHEQTTTSRLPSGQNDIL